MKYIRRNELGLINLKSNSCFHSPWKSPFSPFEQVKSTSRRKMISNEQLIVTLRQTSTRKDIEKGERSLYEIRSLALNNIQSDTLFWRLYSLYQATRCLEGLSMLEYLKKPLKFGGFGRASTEKIYFFYYNIF